MSIVIVGGNDCMVRRYIDLCSEYKCCAKVFTHQSGLKSKIGKPDLMVIFTNTISHKMVHSALKETKGTDTITVRSHTSSLSALKSILEEHTIIGVK